MEKRTYRYVLRENGVVVKEQNLPVEIILQRGRKAAYLFFGYGKDHLKAFTTIAKAHGGKFMPGDKSWEISFEQLRLIRDALQADGFSCPNWGLDGDD
jgi:hypothetical protein